MVEGFSIPGKRSDRLILEANLNYWDTTRFPRIKRIIFDNTIKHKDAVEMVKSGEGRVDLVTRLHPLDTLRVAQSPFAKVVKARGAIESMFGAFNMRKTGSPWNDVRLRQAVNYAINRPDLIRYAAKGNGMIIPALVSPPGYGYDATLTPYPFNPTTAKRLLREAGHPDGLALTLMAPKSLEVQATVIGKMLEQAGFLMTLELLSPSDLNRKTHLSQLDQAPEDEKWDIALLSRRDTPNFTAYSLYHWLALDGPEDWVTEQPELRQLYNQVLRTVDREHQQALIRQMERHTHDQAYFLFLYSPIRLYAVNKAVAFMPHVSGQLVLAETSVTDQHWSVRKQKATVEK